jgi:predicted aspartyl protease
VKFSYSRYAVVATPAAPERTVLYRPVIPVRFVGPKAARNVFALLDTGADESYVTEDMAKKLGVQPIAADAPSIQSASGNLSVTCGRLTVEITDDANSYSFPITVGIVSQDWSEAILGHHGFLEHFDATFSYADKLVTLTARHGNANG